MIKTTTNYDLFHHIEQNRDVDMTHVSSKRLEQSMVEHGWLSAFPLMAVKVGGKLMVIDGQHRLSVARKYGIPVKYVIEDKIIDVAGLNRTSHSWTPTDYATSFAKSGNEEYQELIDFSQTFNLSIQLSAAMLANTHSFGNCASAFENGTWVVKNRTQSYAVAKCYQDLIMISSKFKRMATVKALWAAFHVWYFDPNRLLKGASRRAAALTPVNSYDLSLHMIEDCYNFGHRSPAPLKFDCREAMKLKNPTLAKV